jgi:hypothetical protein
MPDSTNPDLSGWKRIVRRVTRSVRSVERICGIQTRRNSLSLFVTPATSSCSSSGEQNFPSVQTTSIRVDPEQYTSQGKSLANSRSGKRRSASLLAILRRCKTAALATPISSIKGKFVPTRAIPSYCRRALVTVHHLGKADVHPRPV